MLPEVKAGTVAPLYLVWGEEFLVRKDAEAARSRAGPRRRGRAELRGARRRLAAGDRGRADDPAALPRAQGGAGPRPRVPRPEEGPRRTRWARCARRGRPAGGRRARAGCWRWWPGRGGAPAEVDPSAPGRASARAWKEELGIDLADADLDLLREMAALLPRGAGDRARVRRLARSSSCSRTGLPEGHALVVAATDVDPRIRSSRLPEGRGPAGRAEGRRRSCEDLDLRGLAAELPRAVREAARPGREEALRTASAGTCGCSSPSSRSSRSTSRGRSSEVADVELLVGRVREEEFLELSDALQKRDFRAALRYVDEALGAGRRTRCRCSARSPRGARAPRDARADAPQLGRGQLPRSLRRVQVAHLPRSRGGGEGQHGPRAAPLGRVPGDAGRGSVRQAALRRRAPRLRRGGRRAEVARETGSWCSSGSCGPYAPRGRSDAPAA